MSGWAPAVRGLSGACAHEDDGRSSHAESASEAAADTGMATAAARRVLPPPRRAVRREPAAPRCFLTPCLPLDEAAQPLGPAGVPKLAERLGLDLPDALAGDLEVLADLFQGVIALLADAEAHPEDL